MSRTRTRTVSIDPKDETINGLKVGECLKMHSEVDNDVMDSEVCRVTQNKFTAKARIDGEPIMDTSWEITKQRGKQRGKKGKRQKSKKTDKHGRRRR